VPPEASAPRRQSSGFLWLYALAWAGGAVAYVPFLTILLPMRLAAMTAGGRVEWLARMTFTGAVAASIGGIFFGWLSDRTGHRRRWIVAGLILTMILMQAVPLAATPVGLLGLIILWQLSLNMMLAPLAAWAADHLPPDQLGTLGGLLAFAPAIGALAGTIVTIPGLADANGRLALVAILVFCAIAPALLFATPVAATTPAEVQDAIADRSSPAARRARYGMWLARLLVQIAEAALFAYLYYYFRSIDPNRSDSSIARLFGIVLGVAVPVALLVGRWADRRHQPIVPLVVCAALATLGLVAMALARNVTQATAGYILFTLSTTIFLSLHTAQTLRVLPRAEHRGRDLGVFNLTNTVPSLIMPWLTLSVVPIFGFQGLFMILAGFALCASLLLAAISRIST
jgi:MFS family permease